MVGTKLCQIGVDIGGTFTDVVLLWSDDTFAIKKVSSTPDDYSKGIGSGLTQLVEELSLAPSVVKQIVHGTTVATNAILEGKGAPTALITTKGFRDVLELRRIRIPRLYDLFFEKPDPLVPRRFRLEVEERVDANGNVVTTLNEDDVQAAISKIRAGSIEAVAVCFLNSFVRPAHERRVGELVQEALPDVYLSISTDILPEIREYERTSTTTLNAYVAPIVRQYLHSLLDELHALKMECPVLIMQSSGGIMSVGAAMRAPAHLIDSGPAAGAVAAARLAKAAGCQDVISFDMGGTTAKASMIENGRLSLTSEVEVGGGITLSSRLTKGGGYALKLPMIDLSEVGAGGGSIARLNRSGAIEVGPDSAGAVPGPVCYERGGQEITVTDVNVIMGYINPASLAGGAVHLNPEKARRILKAKIAKPLGKDVYEAAYGIHIISNATMIRAVKAVSTYRGRDPRDFVLFAFGGSGPVHAAHMARTLGIKRVIVPLAPGVFSALGLLIADVERHSVQTFLSRTAEVGVKELNSLLSRMESEGRAQLAEAGYTHHRVVVERFADLRYEGQAFELTVPLPEGLLGKKEVLALDELFGHAHEREYGHRGLDEPVEIVNLRVTLRIPKERNYNLVPLAARAQAGRPGGSRAPRREAYFGAEYGMRDTPVLSRSDLTGEDMPGPLIVEEEDATTVVPPDCQAVLDQWSNIVIEIG